jgi:hypothetical protein
VGVIQLRTEYSVYFFLDGGINIVRQWFASLDNADVEWPAFDGLLEIYKAGGLPSIQRAVIDLHDGFYGLLSVRRGGVLPCPIFRLGPFDAQTEITFLAAATWDSRLKRVRPFSAVGSAEENLEVLLADRSRRRRG